jgi:YVTN family beta-propeller protein
VAVLAALLMSLSPARKLVGLGAPKGANSDAPTHSTTIALTPDERRLVVVNREANTVSVIQVKNAAGNDVANKLAEIAVGEEPRCVAVHPSGRAAYVTNGISGTVSVVDLVRFREVQQIRVGTEPRGCALTPTARCFTWRIIRRVPYRFWSFRAIR